MQTSKLFIAACLLALTATRTAAAVEVWKALPTNDDSKRLYRGPYSQAFANGDWQYGWDKGECGYWAGNLYRTMVGISHHTTPSCGFFTGCYYIDTNPTILCSTSGIQVDQSGGVRLFPPAHQSLQLDSSTGDWAYGYPKLECAANQVMTGLTDVSAMCSPTLNMRSGTNCNVRWFLTGNNQGTTSRGDWSFGNEKGECALGEYIKGVALAPVASAILCCSPVWR